MRVVVDTNVLVSALLTAGGAPDQVIQLILQGELVPLVDSRVLGEYDEVLCRPRFMFERSAREDLMRAISSLAEHVVAPPLKVSLPDPDDRMFVEVALAGAADAIVTGNVAHFRPKSGTIAVEVLAPRTVVDRLRR